MRAHLKNIFFFVAALFALTSMANALPVSVNELQTQTTDGQDFIFTFNGLAASDGSGGTLIFRAQGDYGAFAGESLTLKVEGIINQLMGVFSNTGNFIGPATAGGPFDFVNLNVTNTNFEFQRTFNLSGADLDTLLSDSILSATVNLSSFVNVFPDNGFNEFVEVTLNYETAVSVVPLPAALPLFGSGLAFMGFIGWRRKRKAVVQ